MIVCTLTLVWNILLVLALAGCGAALTFATPTSTAAPTADLKPTFVVIPTQAAQAVITSLKLIIPANRFRKPQDIPT